MFFKLSGVFYLANLWGALRNAFNLRTIPDVCITMGFPSRRARSRASNRAPGEVLVTEWKGSNAEKALVSIHPERFEDVNQVALSTLFVIGNEVYGSRRNLGSLTLGVQLNKESGDLQYTADDKGNHAKTTLSSIIKQLGPVPAGFAEMPEPKAVQRGRNLAYACQVCNTKIRAAGQVLQALCLHAGTPQFGAAPASFVLKQAKGVTVTQPAAQPAARAAQPAVAVAAGGPLPAAPATNIENLIKLVKGGAAKVSHGRMFGQEAEPA